MSPRPTPTTLLPPRTSLLLFLQTTITSSSRLPPVLGPMVPAWPVSSPPKHPSPTQSPVLSFTPRRLQSLLLSPTSHLSLPLLLVSNLLLSFLLRWTASSLAFLPRFNRLLQTAPRMNRPVSLNALLLLLQPLMAPASMKMNNPSKALLMAPTPSATGTNPLMMIPLMMNSK